MNKSPATHCFKLSADQGNAEAHSNYSISLYSRERMSVNKSLAAHSFKYAAAQDCKIVQLVSQISQAETDVTEDHLSCHKRYLFEANGEPSDQREEEDAMGEFGTRIRLLSEPGLNHLKIGADAGITNAEFHDYMRFDELTIDL
jgi:hypothetical protein